MTETDPNLRASDADREAVAARLREADEDGRLDTDELEERLAAAYAAKTFGDLAPLTADLSRPAPPAPVAPVAPPVTAPTQEVSTDNRNWRLRWGSWAGTSILLTGIWAIISLTSGHFTTFWPIWFIGFAGLGLVASMFSNWGR